jgi:hypothetical protein
MKYNATKSEYICWYYDRLCGLVVRVSGSVFDSWRYQIFWVVGLERGPLSPVSTTEELLGRKRSGSGLENREYGRWDPSRLPRGTLYPQKLALTSPTSGCRPVGIVRQRTEATELLLLLLLYIDIISIFLSHCGAVFHTSIGCVCVITKGKQWRLSVVF